LLERPALFARVVLSGLDEIAQIFYKIFEVIVDGEEIKEIRQKFNLSRERFAQALKVSAMTVYNWENNITKPSRLAQEKLRSVKRKKYLGV